MAPLLFAILYCFCFVLVSSCFALLCRKALSLFQYILLSFDSFLGSDGPGFRDVCCCVREAGAVISGWQGGQENGRIDRAMLGSGLYVLHSFPVARCKLARFTRRRVTF